VRLAGFNAVRTGGFDAVRMGAVRMGGARFGGRSRDGEPSVDIAPTMDQDSERDDVMVQQEREAATEQ
jgi:hypothetical protein